MSLAITTLAIFGSLLLVALNGFFVAAEFAIVKVRRTRLEELAGKGVKAAKYSIVAVDNLNEMLSAVQLGITFASLGLGWLGEQAFESVFFAAFPQTDALEPGWRQGAAAVLAFFMITMLHVVLGELVPKQIAIQDAERTVLRLAKPLVLFYRASRPLIIAFTRLSDFAARRLSYSRNEEQPLSENELKLVMRDSKDDGVITESEAQIITRAFEFADKRAADIMVPADKVEYISLARPIGQNLATIRMHMHTRFPLCREGLESVIGVVHMKTTWPALLESLSNAAFVRTAKPQLAVEAGVRQDQLLALFQSSRAHLAIVRDPRSQKTIGIVTMEDVLESLVGDIRDEHETEASPKRVS